MAGGVMKPRELDYFEAREKLLVLIASAKRSERRQKRLRCRWEARGRLNAYTTALRILERTRLDG